MSENIKLSVFDKVGCVFTKQKLTKEEIGNDGFMMLRILAMHPDYTESINRVQKYAGVLGHRLLILLQYMFEAANKTPFLDYVKKEDKEYKRFSEISIQILKKLFMVSKERLDEYTPNLWASEDEIKEIYGIN